MHPRLRDVLLFVGGGAVLVHQTAIAESAQTVLVAAGIAMMIGAPAIYRMLDRWDKKQ